MLPLSGDNQNIQISKFLFSSMTKKRIPSSCLLKIVFVDRSSDGQLLLHFHIKLSTAKLLMLLLLLKTWIVPSSSFPFRPFVLQIKLPLLH